MHARFFVAAIAVGGLATFPVASLAQGGGGQRGATAVHDPGRSRGTPPTSTTQPSAPATARPRDAQPVQIVTGPGEGRAEATLTAPVTLVGAAPPADPGARRVMPDLTGRPLRSALAALAPLRLALEIEGQGRVVQQTPRPGQPVAPGATARLTLTAEGRR